MRGSPPYGMNARLARRYRASPGRQTHRSQGDIGRDKLPAGVAFSLPARMGYESPPPSRSRASWLRGMPAAGHPEPRSCSAWRSPKRSSRAPSLQGETPGAAQLGGRPVDGGTASGSVRGGRRRKEGALDFGAAKSPWPAPYPRSTRSGLCIGRGEVAEIPTTADVSGVKTHVQLVPESERIDALHKPNGRKPPSSCRRSGEPLAR